jgi:hypothetical protein
MKLFQNSGTGVPPVSLSLNFPITGGTPVPLETVLKQFLNEFCGTQGRHGLAL